ncbi:MAG TPA: hypothetical protein EYQ41_02540 [Micavibrio sp.]|nr:hypothetical protein [Micavibrio sp.]
MPRIHRQPKKTPDPLANTKRRPTIRSSFERLIKQAIQQDEDGISIDPDRILPEHILTPQVSYGSLPKKITPGTYKRISMTPPGQRF